MNVLMRVARYALASAALLLGTYLTVYNAAVTLGSKFLLPKGRHISPVPFLGGMLGALALLVIPGKWGWRWFWIPLIADVACIPIPVSAIVYYVLRRRSMPTAGQ